MVYVTEDPIKCPRSQAISLLLANDPKILRFLFAPCSQRLCAPANCLLEDAGVLSSGEQIMVRLALDVWSDEGGTSLWDVINVLDEVRFEGFMLALECLRYGNPKH